MPICTSCTEPTAYLYTVYDSAYNFRLEQCTACHAFADPYVEHDTLTLLLDLILLKRDVYRHLLYNRGLGARKAGDPTGKAPTSTNPPDASSRSGQLPQRHSERARWSLIFKLGVALICVDAFIRWTHINSSRTPHHPGDTSATAAWSRAALHGFLRILVGCLFETAAFHAGVVLACYAVLRALPKAQAPVSGIREQFRYSHVPLTLLYSSLTKLFLLCCLSVWHPDASPAAHDAPPLHPDAVFTHPVITGALSLLDADTLDRAWVVRNVLGGMAAGFGLRVVLDCRPVFTTIIIIAGWLVKTAVAGLVSGWVGTGLGADADSKAAGEMWLAYSIP